MKRLNIIKNIIAGLFIYESVLAGSEQGASLKSLHEQAQQAEQEISDAILALESYQKLCQVNQSITSARQALLMSKLCDEIGHHTNGPLDLAQINSPLKIGEKDEKACFRFTRPDVSKKTNYESRFLFNTVQNSVEDGRPELADLDLFPFDKRDAFCIEATKGPRGTEFLAFLIDYQGFPYRLVGSKYEKCSKEVSMAYCLSVYGFMQLVASLSKKREHKDNFEQEYELVNGAPFNDPNRVSSFSPEYLKALSAKIQTPQEMLEDHALELVKVSSALTWLVEKRVGKDFETNFIADLYATQAKLFPKEDIARRGTGIGFVKMLMIGSLHRVTDQLTSQ